MGWKKNESLAYRQILFDIVQANPGVTTGEVQEEYEAWCEENGMVPHTQRTTRKILRGWVEEDYIDGKIENRGNEGRTTIYFPRDDQRMFPEEIAQQFHRGSGQRAKYLPDEVQE